MQVSDDREAFIWQRAYELAASGFHINPITVVTALVQEGYPEASDLLSGELARSDLRDVCARHWRGVAVSGYEPMPASPPAGIARLD